MPNPNDLIATLRREQQSYENMIAALAAKVRARGVDAVPTAHEQQVLDEFRQKRNDLRAHADYLDSQPDYKHPMVGGPLGDAPKGGLVPGGGGGNPTHVPEGAYSQPLGHEQKVQDAVGAGHITEEAIYGALGVLVKAQAVPVDPRESETWARAIGSTKDMLTTGSAGVLVPTPISAAIIDLMRARVVVSALGARTVPMIAKTSTIPRITGDVTAAWLAEGATLTLSDATLDSVTLSAKRLDCGTKVSMELEQDSDPVDIGRVVAESIAAAFALKVDAAALRGSGVDPEPMGVRNTSGVTLYAPNANGDAMTWDLILALVKAVANANAQPTGVVSTPGAALTLAGLKEATTNAYLAPPDIIGRLNLRLETTTALPINLTKGTGTALTEVYAADWRQLLLGMRSALSIQVARELYRPEGKVGIFGRMRVAVGVEHPAAFAVATFVDD